jgi:hypothetical protein
MPSERTTGADEVWGAWLRTPGDGLAPSTRIDYGVFWALCFLLPEVKLNCKKTAGSRPQVGFCLRPFGFWHTGCVFVCDCVRN